ncbi:MAG: transposase [Bacteroidetes bacterium]|nr:transposase [Bacteroidota bacterium]
MIRNHWGIENHHYIKDVILKEDYSKIKKGDSPSNMSIIRNIVINIFHSHKIKKITEQMRILRNNTKKMMDMILA